MHKLMELKEMLCAELEKYGSKDLTAGSLEVVDKLAHSIKNLDKIIESYEEEEYSMARGGRSYARGGGSSSYARGGNSSYARGRGSNARRDNQGRYSREGYSMASEDMVEELRDLMSDADPQTQSDIQRIIKRLEQM